MLRGGIAEICMVLVKLDDILVGKSSYLWRQGTHYMTQLGCGCQYHLMSLVKEGRAPATQPVEEKGKEKSIAGFGVYNAQRLTAAINYVATHGDGFSHG